MNYTQQIAAGLRALEKAPVALLSTEENEVRGIIKVCGIPVFHSALISNTMTDDHVPFIPMWGDDSDHVIARAKFNSAFAIEDER